MSATSTHPAVPTSLINTTEDAAALSFNISFSLNLGSLLHVPSRLFARMRRLDDIFGMHSEIDSANSLGASSEGTSLMRRMRGERPPPPGGLTPLPGPWAFFASGYAVALFAMALLLNRIQHIVVPSRRSFPYRLPFSAARRNRLSFLRLAYSLFFPIDLSSTFSRTMFRIPTLYFLSKAFALWFVILLQTSGTFPSSQWAWLQTIDAWAAHKKMEDVCWSTFGAVCGALTIGALTRGLEGLGATNTSPFNLFGYAFLLHLYSSPITHSLKLEGLPSRPDMHVVITIMMPLLQLFMIHLMGIKQSWSNQRLIPTTICSLLTLVHFHSVLWFSPASYPLLNYMSCLFESLLVLVTLLALVLNALTQLLLEGSVTRPVFGHAATLMPKWDEDFSIVLLRLGTASLEATSVAGLGNELSGVPISSSADIDAKSDPVYGEVEMSRVAGVMSVSHGIEGLGKQRRKKDGFANEIRGVKVGSRQKDPWVDYTWMRELAKFGDGMRKVAVGFWRLLWGFVRGRPVHSRRQRTAPRETRGVSPMREQAEGLDDVGVYERFLMGDPVTDDDEDDFHPAGLSNLEHDDSDGDATDDGESSPDQDNETAGLYTDLSASATTSATAPLLLAHMTDASSLPLTRRRYKTLLTGQQRAETSREGGSWDEFVSDRRTIAAAEKSHRGDGGSDSESRRNCVICTVEERQIICWPCRCLALCDDCRENLASRFAASKHTCPCCRQPVEGFSKIYIP